MRRRHVISLVDTIVKASFLHSFYHDIANLDSRVKRWAYAQTSTLASLPIKEKDNEIVVGLSEEELATCEGLFENEDQIDIFATVVLESNEVSIDGVEALDSNKTPIDGEGL